MVTQTTHDVEAKWHEHAETQSERCQHDHDRDDAHGERLRQQTVFQAVQAEFVEGRQRTQYEEDDRDNHPRAGGQPIAPQRTESGEHEERGERHRQRIRGIPEEEHETLDHRDLEQDEPEPQRREVQRRNSFARKRTPLLAHEEEREQEEHRREDDRDSEEE